VFFCEKSENFLTKWRNFLDRQYANDVYYICMEIYETSVFTKQITGLISDEAYRDLQRVLVAYEKSKKDDLTQKQLTSVRKLVIEELS